MKSLTENCNKNLANHVSQSDVYSQEQIKEPLPKQATSDAKEKSNVQVFYVIQRRERKRNVKPTIEKRL